MNNQISKNNYPMSSLLKTILLLLLVAAAYQTFKSKPVQTVGLVNKDECLITCQAKQNATKTMSQLCLTSELGQSECFYVDNIILFKSYGGRSVVYDFAGNGQYVKENLKEIEDKLSPITSHFFQINRQDLVNMIYAKKLDKCENTLYLCGEFDCAIPRRKYQDVENLMYQYCSLMCQS